MCLKFVVSITGLVLAIISLASVADASNHGGNKSFCMPNAQKANWVAAKPATVAQPAVGVPLAVVGKTGTTGQQEQLKLSHQFEGAAQDEIEVMGRKMAELESLVHRLVGNQIAIEEGERAVALAVCAIQRVVFLREITSQGLENMIRMYAKWNGTEAEINYLAAFAQKEEAEKTQLLGAAFQRLDSLKKSIKQAQAELKSIGQSARKVNNAAEEARQRISLLRHMAPRIRLLNHEELQVVKKFLYQHRHEAQHHSS